LKSGTPSRFRTTYDKSTVNLIDIFVEEEYAAFPVAIHERDALDARSVRLSSTVSSSIEPKSSTAAENTPSSSSRKASFCVLALEAFFFEEVF
jgi:hypothetical protein